MRRVLFVLALVVLWGCSSGGEEVQPNLFGPGGGTLNLPGGGKLIIPAGALDREVTITALPINEVTLEGCETAGQWVDFGPDGTAFLLPVTVEFPVDGSLDRDLGIAWSNGTGAWQRVPATLDRDLGLVSAKIPHFSMGGPVAFGQDLPGACCGSDQCTEGSREDCPGLFLGAGSTCDLYGAPACGAYECCDLTDQAVAVPTGTCSGKAEAVDFCLQVCCLAGGELDMLASGLCTRLGGDARPAGECGCDSDGDCDDQDPCTKDSCDLETRACTHQSPSEPVCGDGCLMGTETCESKLDCGGDPFILCKGCQCEEVDCLEDGDCIDMDPGDCRETFCNGENTCDLRDLADGKPCDDLDPCTDEDQCAAGDCAGTPVQCQTPPQPAECYQAQGTCDQTGECRYDLTDECAVDQDCGEGSTCQGCLCVYGCVVDEDCVDENRDDCELPVCVDNKCVPTPAPENDPCEDGDGCTVDDVCDAAGACVSGPAMDCSTSGDPCWLAPGHCEEGACVFTAAMELTVCKEPDSCYDYFCDGAGACVETLTCQNPDHQCGVAACIGGQCGYEKAQTAACLTSLDCGEGLDCDLSTCQCVGGCGNNVCDPHETDASCPADCGCTALLAGLFGGGSQPECSWGGLADIMETQVGCRCSIDCWLLGNCCADWDVCGMDEPRCGDGTCMSKLLDFTEYPHLYEPAMATESCLNCPEDCGTCDCSLCQPGTPYGCPGFVCGCAAPILEVYPGLGIGQLDYCNITGPYYIDGQLATTIKTPGFCNCTPECLQDNNCCSDSCDACGICPSCGDGVCSLSLKENCGNCPQDCGDCTCGDGKCLAPSETSETCPQDCSCGDHVCSGNEDAQTCPQDCSCGNSLCDPSDNCVNCPQDCGPCS